MFRQDPDASDSLAPAMDAVNLNRIVRTAVRFMKGMDIKQTDEVFELNIFSGVLWFKVDRAATALEV